MNSRINTQEALHSRYKSTIAALSELVKDVALVKHRKTLDEVAKAMTRALEIDQKWSTKCQELQAKLTANEKRVQIALQLSEEDRNVIDTLKNELKNAWDKIEEMHLQSCNGAGKDCSKTEDMEVANVGKRIDKKEETFEELTKEKYRLLDEIEKGKLQVLELEEELTKEKHRLLDEIEKDKLQVFELEEELTIKEKSIEELKSNLTSLSKKLEDAVSENTQLKAELDKTDIKSKPSNDEPVSKKETNSKNEVIFHQMRREQFKWKKALMDIDKKDQISSEKIKHFLKKNKSLNRQLHIIKNQNNLMNLQLAEQTRMLDLLSCQCCKLEEKVKKQMITITALENIRDKYTYMIGNLEEKIHEMETKGIED